MSDGSGEAAPPPSSNGGRVTKQPVDAKTLADARAQALRPANERNSQPGRKVKVLLTGWCTSRPRPHRLLTLELISHESAELPALLRLQTRRREANSLRYLMQGLAALDGSFMDARQLQEAWVQCECGVDATLVVADVLDHVRRGDKQLILTEGGGWLAKARRDS